jgi:hypothetical protein
VSNDGSKLLWGKQQNSSLFCFEGQRDIFFHFGPFWDEARILSETSLLFRRVFSAKLPRLSLGEIFWSFSGLFLPNFFFLFFSLRIIFSASEIPYSYKYISIYIFLFSRTKELLTSCRCA